MIPPKMTIHVGDTLRETGHMRALLFGAYILLQLHHWANGALPDDDEQLSTIARLSPQEWRKAKPVLERLFQQPGWRHGRIEEDLAAAKANYEKRAAAGAEGGKATARAKQSSSKNVAMLEQNCSNAPSNAGSNAPATYNPLPKKEEDAPDGASPPGKAYAFESGVIRLNQRDFDLWKANFTHLDVGAELLAMTEWAGQQRSWFNAVKGALAKKNQQAKERKAQQVEQGGFKWNGIEGVI